MESSQSLTRFIQAQENIYPRVLQELKNGKKTSHWMWFIFPQIEGLGFSSTSKFYAIKSINEARDYLSNPVLGARLQECSAIVFDQNEKSIKDIFGYPDDIKFKSCITLFSFIEPASQLFSGLLKKYFAGEKDEKTLEILNDIK